MSMIALNALHNRVSSPGLQAPAPSGDVLLNIQKAALRAADHKMLRPWRFLMIQGERLTELGELFVKAKECAGQSLDEPARGIIASKPKRAPMILVAVAACRQNPKVPEVEQLLSTGCAVQNMLNAAYAQGVGAMWRTGEFAYSPVVHEGLGLRWNEKIVGFLYLGTPKNAFKPAPELPVEQFFSVWPGSADNL